MRLSATNWMIIGATAATLSGVVYYEGYKSTAYQDSAGKWTVGFGATTDVESTPIKPGDTTTPVDAVRTLQWHADRTAVGLAKCIGDVPLSKGEWEAYVSWAYNVGLQRACTSTLVKKLKATPPDYEGACQELLKWTKAGGTELPGLVKRRRGEYLRCSGQSESLVPSRGR